MMNKLYHLFYVSDYKGGELHSHINLTLSDVADAVIDDSCIWEDLKDFVADDECTKDISNEKYEKITELELLDIVPDSILEEMATRVLYPGNIYAFDTHSDYWCYYTKPSDERLIVVNPIKEEGFIKILREKLKEYYEPYE